MDSCIEFCNSDDLQRVWRDSVNAIQNKSFPKANERVGINFSLRTRSLSLDIIMLTPTQTKDKFSSSKKSDSKKNQKDRDVQEYTLSNMIYLIYNSTQWMIVIKKLPTTTLFFARFRQQTCYCIFAAKKNSNITNYKIHSLSHHLKISSRSVWQFT